MIRKPVLFKLITIALVMGAVISDVAVAQDEIISQIVVEGNRRIPTETILTYVTLEKGDRFDERLVRSDFRVLWRTEFFSDIKIYKRPDAQGGVILVIWVDERQRIRNIEYEGLNALSRTGIEEKMVEPPNDIVIDPGSTVQHAKLTQLTNLIKNMMESQGLEFGEVHYELRTVNDIDVDVVFVVNEGGKVKIKDVRFVGNDSFSQWTLMKVLTKSRPTWMFSWLQKDNIYSSKLLQEDLDSLRAFYASAGFLRVAIKEPIVETLEDDPLLRGKSMEAIITIPINEGIQYRINKLTFEGESLLPEAALRSIFKLKEGNVFSREKLDESIESMQELYRNQGYIEAYIGEEITYPLDKRGFIDMNIRITEGDPFVVNTIDFKGNLTTRDKVLRRNIYIVEQQPFNLQGFQDSVRRLNQLGFFGSVNPEYQIDNEKKTIDVEFEVLETGRNQIQFGGGYSGIEGAFVNFAFSTSNFWGQGQTASIMVQTGARNNNYELSFNEPWLFDKPIGSGLTIFSRRYEYEDFIRNGTGAQASVSFRLGRFMSLFTQYRYEMVEIQNPEGSTYLTSIYYPEGKTTTGSITPTIVRNTVDHPLLPTRGHKDTLRFEYGSEFLGGDFSFWKFISEHISNIPVMRNNIVRFRTQLGYAKILDEGAELPVFERFFMGGENTLRGYELRTVGPRDEDDNIIGGTKSFLINVENAFLVTNEIRIVPFFDAGNAFSDELDLGKLYYSAGVELRFFVPMMNIPFRFIYAKPLNPEDYHRTNSFMFTIGSIF